MPDGTVGALGVFGGIHSNPEHAIFPQSDTAVSNAILSSGWTKTRSQPSRNTKEVLVVGHSSPKKAESWRAVVSNMREEISAANEKVRKLERRMRKMVEAKYEMIENFSIELERLRSSRSEP